jgi:hypothetical protein
MGKHSKDWNTTPTTPNAGGQQKADEFDAQYSQNQVNGSDKEYSGQPRPEPKGRRG